MYGGDVATVHVCGENFEELLRNEDVEVETEEEEVEEEALTEDGEAPASDDAQPTEGAPR